jgi:dTDP-4-amino-4,6-dideoxygalactose transaminase
MLKPGYSRDRIMELLTSRGVQCFSGSCSEMYLEKAFTDLQLGPAQRLPVALLLGETSLAFLIDPSEDLETLQRTVREVGAVMKEASLNGA